MWTRVPTIVDGNTISGDWTISFSDRPVGRISYSPEAPGQGAWAWSLIGFADLSGRAWTEEAAMASIKETAVGRSSEIA